MLTHEEIINLKKEIISECKGMFVLSDNCDEIRRSTAKKLANDDKRIEKIIDRINVWNKLLWIIASSSVGALVTSFFQILINFKANS